MTAVLTDRFCSSCDRGARLWLVAIGNFRLRLCFFCDFLTKGDS